MLGILRAEDADFNLERPRNLLETGDHLLCGWLPADVLPVPVFNNFVMVDLERLASECQGILGLGGLG